MKRSPLKPVSAKRKSQASARQLCVHIVRHRDKVCQFLSRVQGLTEPLGTYTPLSCWGVLDVHEPGHRSQGADPTDPTQCVLICRYHHTWVHDHPNYAKQLQL